MERSQVSVWELAVKPGQLLKVDAGTKVARVSLEPPHVSETAEGGPTNEEMNYTIAGQPEKARGRLTALFSEGGQIRVFVRAMDKCEIRLSAASASLDWDDLSPITAVLPIGERVFYRFPAKMGELIGFQAAASTFDPQFRIFDSRFEEVGEADDSQGSMGARTELIAPKSGFYYLEFQCVGDGGGGQFLLTGTRAVPQRIMLGQKHTGVLETDFDGLWSVTVERPTTLLIRTTGAYGLVYDANGSRLPVASLETADGGRAGLLTLKEAGTYRVWLKGPPGASSYTLRVTSVE